MPIMPFLLGVVTGSVITYIVKDGSSQQLLADTGGKITSGVSSGVSNLTDKITSMFKKSEEPEVAEEVVETTVETTKETTQPA